MNLYDMLKPQEKAFHDSLCAIVERYGPFDQGESGVWVGYRDSQNNEDASIGVKCSNCSFYKEDGGCEILSFKVEPNAICRLAAIPDHLITENKNIELMSKQSPCWEGYVQRGMKPGKGGRPVPNCVPVEKVEYEDAFAKGEETYTPNSGMKAAARRALKWKEQGKATGAGTAVGWGRASDIVAGRPMSLSTVKRMYSFFSRHEVDKKGKDFNNSSNPSNGKIMWEAWGGDAGFAWSRSIVNRQEAKKLWKNSPFSR